MFTLRCCDNGYRCMLNVKFESVSNEIESTVLVVGLVRQVAQLIGSRRKLPVDVEMKQMNCEINRYD